MPCSCFHRIKCNLRSELYSRQLTLVMEEGNYFSDINTFLHEFYFAPIFSDKYFMWCTLGKAPAIDLVSEGTFSLWYWSKGGLRPDSVHPPPPSAAISWLGERGRPWNGRNVSKAVCYKVQSMLWHKNMALCIHLKQWVCC